jgi:hypothetical protein
MQCRSLTKSATTQQQPQQHGNFDEDEGFNRVVVVALLTLLVVTTILPRGHDHEPQRLTALYVPVDPWQHFVLGRGTAGLLQDHSAHFRNEE